ncbi:alpha/beta fold hydrolase [Aeromicrobium sp. NPDC092404]|uniref:alpha/beta fold hydrolase n=1 Tax=Aeromicrobium sp. NPDC092404 TaxID=3154976 RepID=UPI003422D96C
MPLVEVNGAKLNIEDTEAPVGRPDAATVVFGHGLLFSGRMFDDQVDRLAPRYRCVTIDWRGQGRSPAADGGYDMDTLAEDAVAVIHELGLGKVHWVGLSMGGFVGMRLAARRPELIRSLSLLDTSAGPEDPEKVSQYRLLAKIYGLFGLGPVASRVKPLMFGRTYLSSPRSEPQIEAWLNEVKAAKRSGMKQAIYGVTDREPIAAELSSISSPTLVVVGADDVATPVAKAEEINKLIPGSRLEIVPDAGHSSTIEQPDAISDLLETFIDQN